MLDAKLQTTGSFTPSLQVQVNNLFYLPCSGRNTQKYKKKTEEMTHVYPSFYSCSSMSHLIISMSWIIRDAATVPLQNGNTHMKVKGEVTEIADQ